MRTNLCWMWKIRLHAVWKTRCSIKGKTPLLFKNLKSLWPFPVHFCNQPGLFYSVQKKSVNIQLNLHPAISLLLAFHPSSPHKQHVTRGLRLTYIVTLVTCIVFPYFTVQDTALGQRFE
jgi:hypothetical protein